MTREKNTGKLAVIPAAFMMLAMFFLLTGSLTTALADDDLTRDEIVKILADNGVTDPEAAADQLLAKEDDVDMDDVQDYLAGDDDSDDDMDDDSDSDNDMDDDSDDDDDDDDDDGDDDDGDDDDDDDGDDDDDDDDK